MAQQTLFSCSCGWERSLLVGPTMSQPARPMPRVCPAHGDFCDEATCDDCPSAPLDWDGKSCPACGKELDVRVLALVD